MITTRLYLDKRSLSAEGKAQIKLSLSKKGETALIPLGLRIDPNEWDSRTQRVVHRANANALNLQLARQKAHIDDVVYRELASGAFVGKGITYIKRYLARLIDPEPIATELLPFFENIAQAKRESTQIVYNATLKRLRQYSPNVTFEEITPKWLSSWRRSMLDEKLAETYISIQLRNLRAVFNAAVDEGLTSNYPFRKFKIEAIETKPRALDADTLRQIITADVESYAEKYRDIFALTFYLIGINTADLADLRTTKNGRIEYRRRKTGKLYDIKVEPEAQAIIEKYRGREHLLDIFDKYKDYRDARHRINNNLHKIGRVEIGRRGKKTYTPIVEGLTTYYARHSWATIAVNDLDIPIDTVAAALGHSMGNPTTAIYIDFNRAKVDEANRRVIDWVLYGKK